METGTELQSAASAEPSQNVNIQSQKIQFDQCFVELRQECDTLNSDPTYHFVEGGVGVSAECLVLLLSLDVFKATEEWNVGDQFFEALYADYAKLSADEEVLDVIMSLLLWNAS